MHTVLFLCTVVVHINSTGVLTMQASRSTRFAPISFMASPALDNASLHTSHQSLQNPSRITARQPTIAGDVFAVVVWAAMVPGFMWLGTVMGL